MMNTKATMTCRKLRKSKRTASTRSWFFDHSWSDGVDHSIHVCYDPAKHFLWCPKFYSFYCYGWRLWIRISKKANEQNERTVQFRKRFYKVSAWLGTYFPVRLLVSALVHFYPRPINSLALECVIAVLYLMTATFITLEIEKRHLSKNWF